MRFEAGFTSVGRFSPHTTTLLVGFLFSGKKISFISRAYFSEQSAMLFPISGHSRGTASFEESGNTRLGSLSTEYPVAQQIYPKRWAVTRTAAKASLHGCHREHGSWGVKRASELTRAEFPRLFIFRAHEVIVTLEQVTSPRVRQLGSEDGRATTCRSNTTVVGCQRAVASRIAQRRS